MISRSYYILSEPQYTVSDHKTNQVQTDLKLIDQCNSHYIIPNALLVGFHIKK